MSEDAENTEEAQKKSGRKSLLLGLVAAILFGGGGFYATYSGLLGGRGAAAHGPAASEGLEPITDIAFVALDPLVISLGAAGASRHLRFTGQLEVGQQHAEDVRLLMPRVLDVLNGYLRAVDVALLEDPAALIRLRAQMLRRVQIVTGEGRVRDLLVTEFVLN